MLKKSVVLNHKWNLFLLYKDTIIYNNHQGREGMTNSTLSAQFYGPSVQSAKYLQTYEVKLKIEHNQKYLILSNSWILTTITF